MRKSAVFTFELKKIQVGNFDTVLSFITKMCQFHDLLDPFSKNFANFPDFVIFLQNFPKLTKIGQKISNVSKNGQILVKNIKVDKKC